MNFSLEEWENYVTDNYKVKECCEKCSKPVIENIDELNELIMEEFGSRWDKGMKSLVIMAVGYYESEKVLIELLKCWDEAENGINIKG